jgi:hypothetical protein
LYKSEQPSSFVSPTIQRPSETKQSVEAWRTQVNLKRTSFFLAVILAAAAPALADRIPADLQNEETVSHHTRQWIHGNASVDRFDSEDTKFSEVVVLEESRLNTSDTEVNSNEGHAFGRDNDNDWRKRSGKGWDGGDDPISSVAVPEPSLQLLLLFGLAGLGILLYRRDSVKQPI